MRSPHRLSAILVVLSLLAAAWVGTSQAAPAAHAPAAHAPAQRAEQVASPPVPIKLTFRGVTVLRRTISKLGSPESFSHVVSIELYPDYVVATNSDGMRLVIAREELLEITEWPAPPAPVVPPAAPAPAKP